MLLPLSDVDETHDACLFLCEVVEWGNFNRGGARAVQEDARAIAFERPYWLGRPDVPGFAVFCGPRRKHQKMMVIQWYSVQVHWDIWYSEQLYREIWYSVELCSQLFFTWGEAPLPPGSPQPAMDDTDLAGPWNCAGWYQDDGKGQTNHNPHKNTIIIVALFAVMAMSMTDPIICSATTKKTTILSS